MFGKKINKNVWKKNQQECLEKINQRGGRNSETRKGKQSFLCVTRCPDLIHISIKLHEDILNSY